MQAMVEHEAGTVLCGTAQLDDAYLGVGLVGGTAGRRWEKSKVPFIAAIQLKEQVHPLRANFTPLSALNRGDIAAWGGVKLPPQQRRLRWPGCFAGATDIGCTHQRTPVGTRKLTDLRMFR